jgi:hypothetical protein
MYRTILSRDGEAILGSYVRVKITVGYDRDIPCLYMVYARYIHAQLIDLSVQRNDETAIMSQNLHVQITTKAGDIISSLKMHFYSA